MYCDYSDRGNQTTENILASLVRQLALRNTTMLPYIQRLYEQCDHGKSRPHLTRLTEVFRNVCTGYRRTYVVIDALDECEEKCRKSLLAQFDKFDHSVTRLFLTSRPHLTEMKRKFEGFPQIEIKARDSDIKEFILSNIKESGNLSELIEGTTQLEDEIVSTITSKAGEMSVILP
jgi:hypothetical protein